MSIGEAGGELSKNSLLQLHQIRSDVIAAKRVKVWASWGFRPRCVDGLRIS